MNPAFLRWLPIRVRQSLWARCFHPTHPSHHDLFEGARLHFAPHVQMKVIPGDWISDSIAFTGVYEASLSRWIVRRARRASGLLVDVGANLGYFSLLWGAFGKNHRVLAFEASPRNLPILRGNIERNGLRNQCDVRQQAAGRTAGVFPFDLGPADQTGWGGLATASSQESIPVEVVRLDDVVQDREVEILKIDVEGADGWVLEGAEQLLRRQRVHHVWWEQHKPRMRLLGIDEGAPEAFMRAVGYEPVIVGGRQSENPQWYASPRK